jgi:NAD(P)-dependent dehydrogenase (short-subunit alcohol dehydrogenase family)
MDLGLKGKTALITGASRGIGAAIAREFVREGMDVFLVARDPQGLGATASTAARGLAQRILVHPADLTDGRACEAAVAAAVTQLGRLDVLVNNAGATRGIDFLKSTDADWQDGFALKFNGYVRMSRAAWPHLKATKGGIINIVGVMARTPSGAGTIGGAVNAALLNFSKALADLGRTDDVRVNTIHPGHIATDRLTSRIKALARERSISDDQAAAEILASLGVKRFGKPEEIASLATYLASERAAYIHGAELTIDGGVTRGL